MEWDQTLPAELLQEWNALVSDLQVGHSVSLPRSYRADLEENLLTYGLDASTRAYAAVVYLILRSDVSTTVRFVAAKTRVAPLQRQTIPRLELLSALLLSRLIVSVSNSLKSMLPQMPLRCYTDSQVTLFWIRGADKEWKPFIRNKVAQIRRNFSPECWGQCPGETNPADLPSRGLTLLQLSSNKLWHSGPDWLHSSTSSETNPSNIPEECLADMKTKCTQPVHSLMAAEGNQTLGEVTDCGKYSTTARLFRFILRAVKIFKITSLVNHASLTPGELADTEKLWIIDAQQKFAQEGKFPTWEKSVWLIPR